MKKNAGFSLIEIVMVIIIIGIIAAIASRILMQGVSAYLTNINIINSDWQGRIALERMVRDIRAIRSPTDITTASASTLAFTNTSGTSISYTLSGSTITLNGNVLADGIASLTFTYYDSSNAITATPSAIRYILISINVTQNNTNLTLNTSVYPRNLT
jgi:prepilin-type N-terminal cleavage/methylation domain-containing protein